MISRHHLVRGGEDEVLIAGDYNEVLTSANFAALLGAPDRYTIRTQAAANSASWAARAAAYNDWLHDYCEVCPSRLKGVGLVALTSTVYSVRISLQKARADASSAAR